jgi:hypothetical protein
MFFISIINFISPDYHKYKIRLKQYVAGVFFKTMPIYATPRGGFIKSAEMKAPRAIGDTGGDPVFY